MTSTAIGGWSPEMSSLFVQSSLGRGPTWDRCALGTCCGTVRPTQAGGSPSISKRCVSTVCSNHGYLERSKSPSARRDGHRDRRPLGTRCRRNRIVQPSPEPLSRKSIRRPQFDGNSKQGSRLLHGKEGRQRRAPQGAGFAPSESSPLQLGQLESCRLSPRIE